MDWRAWGTGPRGDDGSPGRGQGSCASGTFGSPRGGLAPGTDLRDGKRSSLIGGRQSAERGRKRKRSGKEALYRGDRPLLTAARLPWADLGSYGCHNSLSRLQRNTSHIFSFRAGRQRRSTCYTFASGHFSSRRERVSRRPLEGICQAARPKLLELGVTGPKIQGRPSAPDVIYRSSIPPELADIRDVLDQSLPPTAERVERTRHLSRGNGQRTFAFLRSCAEHATRHST